MGKPGIEHTAIGSAVIIASEEVENGAVVPHGVAPHGHPMRDIGDDEIDFRCRCADPMADDIQRRRCGIEDADIGEALAQKPVDKQRCAAADIDDRSRLADAGTRDRGQRGAGRRLIPTYAVGGFGAIDGVPMCRLRLVHGCLPPGHSLYPNAEARQQ